MDNVNTILAVCSGTRLSVPPNCPEPLGKLLQRCWMIEPNDRPTFDEIYQELMQIDQGY